MGLLPYLGLSTCLHRSKNLDRAEELQESCDSRGRGREEKLRVAQAITDAKIEELTREVRKHNNFAEKIPVIQEQIKVVNHRLADLEDIERKDHP